VNIAARLGSNGIAITPRVYSFAVIVLNHWTIRDRGAHIGAPLPPSGKGRPKAGTPETGVVNRRHINAHKKGFPGRL